MSANLLRALMRRFRDQSPAGGNPSADGELLRRYVQSRDADAFSTLVRRHGPMVWGVCRRNVRTHADAEDAFQATFVVLTTRASSIRKPDALECWLYGVALRVSQRVRSTSSRHAADEVEDIAQSADDPPVPREHLTALDEELGRLSEKYRGPLVLCYLQERSQDEAARQLRVSLSTLKRRLDRGRELLRERMERRGVDRSAVMGALGAVAAIPVGLSAATTTAVLCSEISGPVGAITREVLFAMWTTKLRTWAAGFVASGGLLTGMAAYYTATQTGQSADAPAAAKVLSPAAPIPAAPPTPAAPARTEAPQVATTLKLAELDVELAEVKLNETKAQLEFAQAAHAAARGSATEVTVAEANLKRAMIEVQKAKITRDAERETLNRLGQSAAPPAAVTPSALLPSVRKLREEQLKTAEETYSWARQRREAGITKADDVVDAVRWSERIRDAKTALDPSSRGKAANEHLERARELEAYITARVQAGRDRPEDASAVTYLRIDAEIAAQLAETR